MKHRILSFLAIIILGCNGSIVSSSLITPRLDEDVNLKVGQSATFNGEFTFTFVSVPSDSRCPTNVDCIWIGDAAIVLAFIKGPDTLHTSLEPRELLREPYDIKLIRLSPYPVYPQDIPPDSYVVTLRVSKN